MAIRCGLWVLIVVSLGVRLLVAWLLGLGNDESYYHLYVLNPDWSYFDHPPMVAIIQSIGVGLFGGLSSPLALRSGFLLVFAGSTFLMARLTRRLFGSSDGLIAAILLNVTGYFGIAAGTFVLPDGPLVFFWLLTLDALVSALELSGKVEGRLVSWFWVGVAWGGALLSKYHAVFLPLGVLWFLWREPTCRHWLKRPGPYVALLVGLCLFSPVLYWNAGHEWASFRFQGGRAVGGFWFRPEALASAIGGQALYLFPWVWVFVVGALFRGGRLFLRGSCRAEHFLMCQVMPPLITLLGVACHRDVLPHWSLVGVVGCLPLLGRDWAVSFSSNRRAICRRLVLLPSLSILVVLVVLLQARVGLFQKEGTSTIPVLPVAHDPSVDQFGWDQVATELERLGLTKRPKTFLFTSKWYHSGQLAFAVGDQLPVYCFNGGDSRGFSFWASPDESVGRDGVLVVVDPCSTEPSAFDRWFERIEPVADLKIERSGTVVRRIRLYLCVGQSHPFPWD